MTTPEQMRAIWVEALKPWNLGFEDPTQSRPPKIGASFILAPDGGLIRTNTRTDMSTKEGEVILNYPAEDYALTIIEGPDWPKTSAEKKSVVVRAKDQINGVSFVHGKPEFVNFGTGLKRLARAATNNVCYRRTEDGRIEWWYCSRQFRIFYLFVNGVRFSENTIKKQMRTRPGVYRGIVEPMYNGMYNYVALAFYMNKIPGQFRKITIVVPYVYVESASFRESRGIAPKKVEVPKKKGWGDEMEEGIEDEDVEDDE